MKKTTPTIRTVAQAAGVSTATVSKFINGMQRFSPTVEATIQRVINELGYQSNPLAQSMITGKTKTLGLAVLDIANPHFTSIIKGANRVATEHGYTLLLIDTEETPTRERPLLEALSRKVDGIIAYTRMAETELAWMSTLGKPVVLFGRLTQLALPCVSSDDYLGGYMLAQHLVASGHRAIGHLGFAASRRNEERLAGIRALLALSGLEPKVYQVDAPTAAGGERICSSIVLGPERPSAVICYNDLLALGFMKEAQGLGIAVPTDLSIAGFDNIVYGRYTSPALTTVDQQSERMGEIAVQRLLAAIEGEVDTSCTCIEPRLIKRDSIVAHGRVKERAT